MKCTRKNKTNQQIDRISTKHAIIGVDIAKEIHVAQAVDFRGRQLNSRPLSFSNSREGFESFQGWLRKVQAQNRLHSVIVGMEPTGHYWFQLANELREQKIQVALVNPVTTHRNKENRDNCPSKNDAKDALTIADVVSRGFYTDYAPQKVEFERLKTAMSNREYWVIQTGSLKNRIIRWIDLYFPEFHQVFPDWTVPRAIASLHAFPLPCDVKERKVEEIIVCWREQGMQRAGGNRGKEKAVQLLQAAARSIGETRVPEEAKKDLKRLLRAYEQNVTELEQIKEEIEEVLGDIPSVPLIQSIPGMPTITIAALFGCAGNLNHYDHGQQLMRRAGLNLAERMSGTFKGQVKLSKRGDAMLRKYLFQAVLSLVKLNPDFRRWHEDNQRKGMKKMASIFKLIGKLARILIAMVKNKTTYRSEEPSHQHPAA